MQINDKNKYEYSWVSNIKKLQVLPSRYFTSFNLCEIIFQALSIFTLIFIVNKF